MWSLLHIRRRGARRLSFPHSLSPIQAEPTVRGRKFVKPAVTEGAAGVMHFWNGEKEAIFPYELAKVRP